MIVCCCNCISEDMVRTAIAEGADCYNCVLKIHNSEPCCGTCKEVVEQMLLESSNIE